MQPRTVPQASCSVASWLVEVGEKIIMPTPSRRQFLHCSASLAGGSALAALAWRAGETTAASDASAPENPLQSATRTSLALGTSVAITALHAEQTTAARAVDAAFAELELVERLMSIYRPDSQLARLNRDRQLANAHPYLLEVLRAATEMSARTDGAFDVTVQPLWSLFAAAQRRGALPEAAEVRAAQNLVDWRQLELSGSSVRLRGTESAVTLNGIAQGYAADRAAAAMQAAGVQQALINTGEVGSLGTKQKGQAWTVGIQHPRHPDAHLCLAKLAGRCLATSGDYATSFTPDHRLNHLFDPRTGHSPGELVSATVVAPTAMLADSLSTAIFVLGVERGMALAEATPGTDVLLVTRAGQTLMSHQFPLAS